MKRCWALIITENTSQNHNVILVMPVRKANISTWVPMWRNWKALVLLMRMRKWQSVVENNLMAAQKATHSLTIWLVCHSNTKSTWSRDLGGEMLCPMSTAAACPIIKSQMLHKCPSKRGQSTKIWYEPNTMDSIFLWFWVKSVQTESKLETGRTRQERVSCLAYTEFLLEMRKFWRHWIIQHANMSKAVLKCLEGQTYYYFYAYFTTLSFLYSPG